MRLEDKTAVISGATRGIGRAIALALAKEGANISFNFSKSNQEAKELEDTLGGLGVQAKAFQVDIKDWTAVAGWIEQVKEWLGGIDIIVNNAGIIKDGALALMDIKDWHEVLSTNLDGTFNLTKAAIITMLKQKSGSIVNITSVSGILGLPRQTNYSASKAGIIGFTKALAKEVAGYNVRVNAVAPGFIETDMLKELKQEYRDKVLQKIPLGRMGKAEEVANVVKFLVSDEAGFITGQTIIIDGGLSIV